MEVPSEERSTHTSPNHSFDVHSVAVVWVGAMSVDVGVAGGEVMRWDKVAAVLPLEVDDLSLQPHTAPGVLQDVVGVGVVLLLWKAVVVGSLQPPKKPGCSHVVVGAMVVVRVLVVVASSLQPNQPGVLQVVVVTVVVVKLRVEVAVPVVVDSSRHPHHPGVAQVSVLVIVLLVVDEAVVVVLSVPLLS